MPINRDAWRAQVVETALEPDLPIIDAHHHLWPEAPVPHMESYDVGDLLADKTGSGHNIIATVFVEAHSRYRAGGPTELKPVGETEFADRVGRDADALGGRMAGACAAIVAQADMMLGDRVEEVLIAHRQASARIRGIRYLIANDPDYPGPLPSRPGMLASPAFRSAFGRLAQHGLSFDVWVMHPQLFELAELAGAYPGTTIILDHVGGPMGTGRHATTDAFDDWRKGMVALARHSNVRLKIGGLNMEFTRLGAPTDGPKPWSSAQMAEVQGRYILPAIDIFGPSRCMFESNFPVDRMVTDATVLWNCFKRLSSGFSDRERADLFQGTASRTYRLQEVDSGVNARF